MARLLPRPRSFRQTPDGMATWGQRVCEEIESQFADIIAALSTMPDIPSVRVAADYTGAVLTDELPVTIQAYRYTGDTDNTTDATWDFETDNGGITASVTDGAFEITAVTALVTKVTLSSTYSGITKSRVFMVYKDVAAPPNTGTTGGSTGGTSASTTTFSTFNSTTHAAVTGELIVTVGSGGTVDLSAPLSVRASRVGASPSASYPVHAIWRWWNGSSWADVGTEVASDPDAGFDSDQVRIDGSITVTEQKTGLTPSTSAKFKLYARNDSGTHSMQFVGTASAVAG